MRNATRHLCLPLFFFLFTFAGYSQEGATETLVVKTNIYCDHCNRCESCGPRIYNALMEQRGVRKVRIDGEENTISVTYKTTKITPELIRKAINETGFDADGSKAPDAAYAKLDACCKKE